MIRGEAVSSIMGSMNSADNVAGATNFFLMFLALPPASELHQSLMVAMVSLLYQIWPPQLRCT